MRLRLRLLFQVYLFQNSEGFLPTSVSGILHIIRKTNDDVTSEQRVAHEIRWMEVVCSCRCAVKSVVFEVCI